MDELQLLVSEGTSLELQVGNDDTSSTDGRGGGGGGGSEGGGGGGGGGEGRAGKNGWKPLHLVAPFVSGAEGSDAFTISTLSNDFVLQRFFYSNNRRKEERNFKTMLKESKDASYVRPY